MNNEERIAKLVPADLVNGTCPPRVSPERLRSGRHWWDRSSHFPCLYRRQHGGSMTSMQLSVALRFWPVLGGFLSWVG